MLGRTIEAVLEQYTGSLMSVPGVVGTAIGQRERNPCIKVFVVTKTRQVIATIPSALHGFPVAIEETGDLRALKST
jgi:hypothetical protein